MFRMTATANGRKALDVLRPREVQFANLLGAGHTHDALQTTLDVLRSARATVEAADRSQSR